MKSYEYIFLYYFIFINYFNNIVRFRLNLPEKTRLLE